MNEQTKYWRQLTEDESRGRTAEGMIYVPPLAAWFIPDWPRWPEPRDAKTDPPKREDANKHGWVLACDGNGDWGIWSINHVNGGFTKWLPLPPVPMPEKSAAEKAWDIAVVSAQIPPIEIDHQRNAFMLGFEAGKSAK